jgi:hypothetical protein
VRPPSDTELAGVCIAGMHRSGTSLLAKLLLRMGLDLGDEATLIPSDPEDNPDGYFEQAAFVALDDELLAMLGGHVSAPAPAAGGWEREPRFAAPQARAAALVGETFARSPWGFKDPRASLLLPFWRAVAPGLRVIVCVRNPAEVAASMLRRHTDPGWDHWMRMWLRHTADALTGSAGAERIVVHYDDLVAEPERVLPRVGALALGREPGHAAVAAAAAEVDPSRRRVAVGLGELLEDPRVPPEVAAAYATLRAGGTLDGATRVLAGLHDALEDRTEVALAARTRQVAQLRAALADAAAELDSARSAGVAPPRPAEERPGRLGRALRRRR